MRTLVLTTLNPYPPDSGGKITTAGVIEYWATRGLVDVLCLGSQYEHVSINTSVTVRTFRQRGLIARDSTLETGLMLVEALLRGKSYVLNKFWSPHLREAVWIGTAEGRWDVIYVDHLPMAQYIPDGTAFLLDENNVESVIMGQRAARSPSPLLRALYRREHSIVQRAEVVLCNRAACVLTVSEEDKQTLEALGVSTPIKVLPVLLGDHWVPKQTGRGKRVGVLGSATWEENREALDWFLREIVSKLSRDVDVLVAGRGTSRLVPRETSVAVWDEFSTTEFARAVDVLAVPLLSGGGIRVKILQALEAGIPVVATSKGAEGLHDAPLSIADSPSEFAMAIEGILFMSDELLGRLISKGRNYVAERYSFDRFESVITPLIAYTR